jgi:hypothetical protein
MSVFSGFAIYRERFKNRNYARRRLAFVSGEADAEAAQLE